MSGGRRSAISGKPAAVEETRARDMVERRVVIDRARLLSSWLEGSSFRSDG